MCIRQERPKRYSRESGDVYKVYLMLNLDVCVWF